MAETPVRRLAAILSADIVGYSRRMAANEATAVRTVSTYRDQVGEQVRGHGGHLVDFTGDNFLAEFATATSPLTPCSVSRTWPLPACVPP